MAGMARIGGWALSLAEVQLGCWDQDIRVQLEALRSWRDVDEQPYAIVVLIYCLPLLEF